MLDILHDGLVACEEYCMVLLRYRDMWQDTSGIDWNHVYGSVIDKEIINKQLQTKTSQIS